MTTLFAFLFVLTILIVVHEFGHFIVAKWIGVRVEKFSLGFGPKLISFRKGETEYMISAFPLGGYVKMSGENVEEELQGEPWEFSSRSILERAAIVVSGPFMNLVLAVVVMSVVFMMGREVPQYLTQIPVVGWIEKGSLAEQAGLKIDDRILFVNEQQINTWEQLLITIASNYNQALEIQVSRKGLYTLCFLNTRTDDSTQMQHFGLYHHIPVRVGGLTPGYPAEEAGIKIGDLITAVNGEKVSHWFQFSDIVQHSYNQELELTVERKFGSIKIKVTPQRDVLKGGVGLIGIQSVQKTIIRKYGFRKAVPNAFKEVKNLFVLTVDFFKKLVTGQASAKTIGGPIAIAKYAGEAAKVGMSTLFHLMGFLSLQLGFLNLLPVPILDGGILTFLAAEAILRRPVSIRTREIAQQIGLSLILLLMVFACYNDIVRFFTG